LYFRRILAIFSGFNTSKGLKTLKSEKIQGLSDN